jgi:hypothetical protein
MHCHLWLQFLTAKHRRGETNVPEHRELDSTTETILEVVPGVVEVHEV